MDCGQNHIYSRTYVSFKHFIFSNVAGLVQKIEDCVVKTLLCAEMPVATACKMFMPHRGNCFGKYTHVMLMTEGQSYTPRLTFIIELLYAI